MAKNKQSGGGDDPARKHPRLADSEFKVRTVTVPCFVEINVKSRDPEEAAFLAEEAVRDLRGTPFYHGAAGFKLAAVISPICKPD